LLQFVLFFCYSDFCIFLESKNIYLSIDADIKKYACSVPSNCGDLHKFIKTFCETNLLEKKRSVKELNLSSKYFSHNLYDDQQAIILNTNTLVNKGNYYFKAPMTLIPKSASSWIKDDLDKLKVCFVEKESFHAFSNITTSSKSLGLIDELKDLADSNYCREYSNFSRDDAFLKNFFTKAIFIIQKYHDHESAVDCFVQQLLYRIGFFDDWLFVFPKRRLTLTYGRSENICTAVPDFTIMDVVSNARMAVIEDKSVDNVYVNSEPQLIAELIALLQLDACICPVIGVRVSGLKFWFYRIENPKLLLSAMSSKVGVDEETTVEKLGGSDGFNFLDFEDRTKIITTLDNICTVVKREGEESNHRDSETNTSS